jgi:flagellar biosynthesis protein
MSDISDTSGKTKDDKNKAQPKTVVALGYDPEKDKAPRILASGRGHVAEQILAIAKQHQLPIREDPILAEALSQVDLNQVVPAELYAVVAEVFAFVYRLKQKKTDS